MALIEIHKPIKEKPYILTNYEKTWLDLMPEEQLRSTNHDERLIKMMAEGAIRDADPEIIRRDIYKALDKGDFERLLHAAKPLTPQERKRIVDGMYITLLNKTKDSKLSHEDTKKIYILSQDRNISLEELCLRLFTLKIKV
jgi:hypothetical protein